MGWRSTQSGRVSFWFLSWLNVGERTGPLRWPCPWRMVMRGRSMKRDWHNERDKQAEGQKQYQELKLKFVTSDVTYCILRLVVSSHYRLHCTDRWANVGSCSHIQLSWVTVEIEVSLTVEAAMSFMTELGGIDERSQMAEGPLGLELEPLAWDLSLTPLGSSSGLSWNEMTTRTHLFVVVRNYMMFLNTFVQVLCYS